MLTLACLQAQGSAVQQQSSAVTVKRVMKREGRVGRLGSLSGKRQGVWGCASRMGLGSAGLGPWAQEHLCEV